MKYCVGLMNVFHEFIFKKQVNMKGINLTHKLFLVCFTFLLFGLYDTSFALPIMQIQSQYESNVSVSLVDADTDQVIYQKNQNTPRLVASNMKLFTTMIGLNQLGADYHWHTKLYYDGVINQKVLYGNLYLYGSGDPTLDTKALYLIFSHLKDLGIGKIAGNIILDNTSFNTKPTYSMLHYQDYDSDTVLPDGLMLDANLNHLYIDKVDDKFIVRSDFYKYDVVNKLKVANESLQCNGNYSRLKLKLINQILTVSGELSKSCGNLDLIYNILPHFDYDQMKVQQVLDNFNIKVDGKYLEKSMPLNKNLIYDYSSDSLEAMLIKMNRFSNNIIAETVLLKSGSNAYPKLDNYTAEQKLFYEFITKNNLINPMASLENGAGLSRYEYFTTQNIVNLLRLAKNSLQQANFEATLPVPGQEGSLRNRFLDYRKQLHAKTGTLDDTMALSGYFYAKSGKKYIFSIVANNFDTTNAKNVELFNSWVNELLISLSQD